MNLSDRDQTLIDAYLQGTLTDAQQAEWTGRIEDPAFATAVDELRAVRDALILENRSDVRKTISAWDKPSGKTRSIPWRIIAGVAAGIALLVVSYFLVGPDAQPDMTTQSLASAYLEPYPNVIAPLQKGSGDGTTYDEAFQLYESGHYLKAKDALQNLNPNDEAVEFYKALSLLFSGKDLEAKAVLNNIASVPDHRFYQPALWYLALAQINLGENDQARITLRHVATGPTPFSAKAAELMQKL